jgi:hypothetical protein
VRIEHAALLAAGIVTLVGVHRRRRLRAALPRARVPPPRSDVMATERRLRQVGGGERAARLDVAVRAAAHALIGTGARIDAVLVAADGAMDLLLTSPVPPTEPWAAGGVRHGVEPHRWWRLPASVPIELLAEDARRAGQPCIAMVHVGVSDDGDDVVLDLESVGTLVVHADHVVADDVVRAVASGLASSEYAEVAHLITSSLAPSTLLGHRHAHAVASVDAAFDLAAELVGTTAAEERSTFELRSLHTGGEVWEPAVIVFDSADGSGLTESTVELPTGGHGLAVVAAMPIGTAPEAGARLTASTTSWVLELRETSIPMTPIGVSPDDIDDVSALLDDATASLVWADDVTDGADSPTDSDDDAPFAERPHELVVRLMGSVEVVDAEGAAGSFERSKTVELIAWLATHRDRATRAGARTALWELDVRDATFANVVSEARRGLARMVPPPEGEEWIARTLNESLPIHPRVVTDADLIEDRLAHARVQPPARAIETLRPAVAMIRDTPFAGTGYLWPDAEGLMSNLVLLGTGAATELASHALSVGDTELVFWATGQGLRVLPGHEELIGLRMRAHAQAGDLAAVRHEWESYERVIVSDPWSDGEPAPKLLRLRRELLDPSP